MSFRLGAVCTIVFSCWLVAGCGPSPSTNAATDPTSGRTCTSPIAGKAWYMQPSSLSYFDGDQVFTVDTYATSAQTGVLRASFTASGRSYDFDPDVSQATLGVFTVSFTGSARFSDQHSQRNVRIDVQGKVDENVGAADITLSAEGEAAPLHLVSAATDTSGAVTLSKRIAADIQAKNWPDVYDATKSLPAAPDKASLVKDLDAKFRQVLTACRLGPAQYTKLPPPLTIVYERFEDVLAVTVTQRGHAPAATFVFIRLMRSGNGNWGFVDAFAPGTNPTANGGPEDHGIPVPTP